MRRPEKAGIATRQSCKFGGKERRLVGWVEAVEGKFNKTTENPGTKVSHQRSLVSSRIEIALVFMPYSVTGWKKPSGKPDFGGVNVAIDFTAQ